jgi:tripartite-type tricarboxylate transporter receptor subunit TctC
MIRDGRLRLLAVSTPERWPLVPDTPTMEESGLGRLESQWIGAFVRIETPDEAVEVIADALLEGLKQETVQQQFDNLGFAIVGEGPDETLADLVRETEMWCETIEAAGISID